MEVAIGAAVGRVVWVVVVSNAVAALTQVTAGVNVEAVGPRFESIDGPINDTVTSNLSEPHHTPDRAFGEANRVADDCDCRRELPNSCDDCIPASRLQQGLQLVCW